MPGIPSDAQRTTLHFSAGPITGMPRDANLSSRHLGTNMRSRRALDTDRASPQATTNRLYGRKIAVPDVLQIVGNPIDPE